jgi:SAM-dependent methyltransferase
MRGMSHGDPGQALAAAGALGLSAQQAALLRGALSSGFLARCRTPVTAAELEGFPHAADQLKALTAAGILTGAAGSYTLSGSYAGLFDGGADRFVLRALDGVAVRQRLLADQFTPGGGHTFWQLSDADRATIAASVTFDPSTDFALLACRAIVEPIPGLREVLEGESRYLELGCGLGGALLAFLRLYPRLTVVAVDLAADLVAASRAQAESLGVADRVSYVIGDVADFRDGRPFDTAFWSQFFYPEHSRAAALATAHASLRPGGRLVAPVLVADEGHRADPGSTLDTLLIRSWGVPVLTSDEVCAEIEAAGFTTPKIYAGTITTTVVATRP